MKLTKVERLVLANQYLILSKLSPENAEEYNRVREALEYGYETAYQDAFAARLVDELSVDECMLVIHAMDMYQGIQVAYGRLEDKARIEEQSTLFPGFDGNHETAYMTYARFLVEKEQRFASLKLGSDGFNSHMPMVGI